MTNVDVGMRIATEEIFGPVLVVMGYRQLEEAISYINAGPSPLVAYWYGSGGERFRQFVRRTRTGGVARNDFALHMSFSETPFGGVGQSGMGAYHGRAGFDTFSHHRSVVESDLPFSVTSIASPPFSRWTALFANVSVKATRWRTNRRIESFEQRKPSGDS